MTTKVLLAGIPLGVLATGALVGEADAATPNPQPTTQTFNYNLGAPFASPSPTPTGTPTFSASQSEQSGPPFQIAIGGSTAQYNYQYAYTPFDATPKLGTQGNALVNPTIYHDDSLPSNNEAFAPAPYSDVDPSKPGVATGPTVPKNLEPTGPIGDFNTFAASTDNYLHLKFDIDGTSYLGSAHFSNDGQTLYDITYIAAAVPEPAVWAELILGFGAIGGLARVQRRRRQRDLALAA